MRCVQVCDKVQILSVWDAVNTGAKISVNVRNNKKLPHVICIVNCPVGALNERNDVKKVIHALDDKELVTIVQVAPAVRAAYGEGFLFAEKLLLKKDLLVYLSI